MGVITQRAAEAHAIRLHGCAYGDARGQYPHEDQLKRMLFDCTDAHGGSTGRRVKELACTVGERSGTGGAGSRGQPVAIVGMACRFPGAQDLDAFWEVLAEGRNTVTEFAPGYSADGERLDDLLRGLEDKNEACRFGAFVDGIEQFDADFFRISPVEAQLLDPQQRMMLETSWLALEDAGIDPSRLRGSRTGVYTGVSNDEYHMLVLDSVEPAGAAGSLYALSGTNLNGASGRVSYVLGLTGPAKAIDAACASSFSLEVRCSSLWLGMGLVASSCPVSAGEPLLGQLSEVGVVESIDCGQGTAWRRVWTGQRAGSRVAALRVCCAHAVTARSAVSSR